MLVVFDWDGTLMDSAAKIVASMQQAAVNSGLAPQTTYAIEQIIGLALPQAIEVLYPDVPLLQRETVQQEYSREFIINDAVPCELFAGVEDCLDNLLVDGHAIAVATGKSRRGLDRVLQGRGWLNKFAATRCADETASKPSPLMLQQLMQQLNFATADTLMVGDTEFDLAMACNANVRSVGVSYGAHSVEQLQKHQPLYILDQLIDLPALLA